MCIGLLDFAWAIRTLYVDAALGAPTCDLDPLHTATIPQYMACVQRYTALIAPHSPVDLAQEERDLRGWLSHSASVGEAAHKAQGFLDYTHATIAQRAAASEAFVRETPPARLRELASEGARDGPVRQVPAPSPTTPDPVSLPPLPSLHAPPPPVALIPLSISLPLWHTSFSSESPSPSPPGLCLNWKKGGGGSPPPPRRVVNNSSREKLNFLKENIFGPFLVHPRP